MAYMKRDRPGGSLARVVVGARTPTRTTVARVATRTALRRPDSTRNGAPSYRDGAVSAPSVGVPSSGSAVGAGLGACNGASGDDVACVRTRRTVFARCLGDGQDSHGPRHETRGCPEGPIRQRTGRPRRNAA